MELYKKYRPESLAAIVGNEEVVSALTGMLAAGTLPHTLLLTGPSGTGKTTLARIIKGMLKCHDLDFTEMNSASFRGIDSVRDIQRVMRLSPAAGPVRVWVIDEVHKWTSDAMAASLKMLEDTPPHVYFILCTTDPKKLSAAMLTRATELMLKALAYPQLYALAEKVCRRERAAISKEVLDSLAALAGGSARALLVLLEKALAVPESQRLAAIESAAAAENAAIDLCRALIKKEPWPKVAAILSGLNAEPEQVRWAVLGYARAVLLKGGQWQAYNVITCFSSPFYDNRDAGLAAACYEAISLKE